MTSGSIKKDSKRGSWFFVVDAATPDGRRRQVRRRGFTTKKDAQNALDKLRGQVANGLYLEPSSLVLGQYLTKHWLPSLAATVRPTTADTYRRLVDKHIVPPLGAVRLQALERAQVSRWLVGLSAAKLSAKSVRNIHGVLSKALSDAVALDLVSRNVAAHAKGLPAAERPNVKAWTSDQLAKFLSATADDRLAPLWRFVAVTGVRRGEALGLRWADLDLDAGTATITHQRTIAGGSIVEGAPKTRAGARTVALDAGTVAVMRSWRRRQGSERLAMGGGWAATDLVFTHPDGTGLWPQAVTARFRTTAAAQGLPEIGVHGLRHTAATLMVSSGVNPRVVQQRLGHAHVAITLGLYTHVLPGHDRDAVDALARVLDGVS